MMDVELELNKMEHPEKHKKEKNEVDANDLHNQASLPKDDVDDFTELAKSYIEKLDHEEGKKTKKLIAFYATSFKKDKALRENAKKYINLKFDDQITKGTIDVGQLLEAYKLSQTLLKESQSHYVDKNISKNKSLLRNKILSVCSTTIAVVTTVGIVVDLVFRIVGK